MYHWKQWCGSHTLQFTGYHHSWNGLMLGCDILQVTNHTPDLSLLEICERKLRWGEPCHWNWLSIQKDNNIVLLSITCCVMITNMILDLIVHAVRHTLLWLHIKDRAKSFPFLQEPLIHTSKCEGLWNLQWESLQIIIVSYSTTEHRAHEWARFK